jgi:hypothetical protein
MMKKKKRNRDASPPNPTRMHGPIRPFFSFAEAAALIAFSDPDGESFGPFRRRPHLAVRAARRTE